MARSLAVLLRRRVLLIRRKALRKDLQRGKCNELSMGSKPDYNVVQIKFARLRYSCRKIGLLDNKL